MVLLWDLYHKRFRGAYTWLSAGAANICDFAALEEMFMPVNSLGPYVQSGQHPGLDQPGSA